MELSSWGRTIGAYYRWLRGCSPDTARLWKSRLNSTHPASVEGAVAEGVAWAVLNDRASQVELADSAGTGGPDFRCVSANHGSYLVEVTNISHQVTTEKTGLSDEDDGPGYYSLLTPQIKREVLAKGEQFSTQLFSEPLVVLVTTFHSAASILCMNREVVEYLLYSEPKIVVKLDTQRGATSGNPSSEADFSFSVFTRARSLQVARRHISAVLVGGFGILPTEKQILGALHPDPLQTLDPLALPGVPFCRFAVWPPRDQVEVEWSDGKSTDDD